MTITTRTTLQYKANSLKANGRPKTLRYSKPHVQRCFKTISFLADILDSCLILRAAYIVECIQFIIILYLTENIISDSDCKSIVVFWCSLIRPYACQDFAFIFNQRNQCSLFGLKGIKCQTACIYWYYLGIQYTVYCTCNVIINMCFCDFFLQDVTCVFIDMLQSFIVRK